MNDLHTLGRWLADRARTTPERVAIDYDGEPTTYAQLDRDSDALAAAWHAAGLRRGERVATLTASRPEHVAAFFACAKSSLVLVPLNWRLAAPELAYQLDDAEPALLLVEEPHGGLAAAALERASIRPTTLRLEAHPNRPGGSEPRRPRDDDPLLLVYTSGTTGRPKGAVLTHANCFWTNVSLDLATGLGGDDVVLSVLPQFHVGGWNVQPLLAWWKGARVVLERAFDPARCLRLIEEKRVTTMMGVPAMYQFMAQEASFAATDLSSLRRAVVGGAPMLESVLAAWHERGVAIVQGYGLTEAAPNVLCLAPEDAVRKRGATGKPYPYVEVDLRGGEIVVRGPNVFAGYWRNAEATGAVLRDGWLSTGDVAERDNDGCYWIRGRVKDMLISGGENVYPAEIENVLHEHAAVADAAVVGRADPRWGEVPVAFVVLEPGAQATEEELLAHCRERLARYKVPCALRFLDALPRSAVAKILKDELRALAAAEVTA